MLLHPCSSTFLSFHILFNLFVGFNGKLWVKIRVIDYIKIPSWIFKSMSATTADATASATASATAAYTTWIFKKIAVVSRKH